MSFGLFLSVVWHKVAKLMKKFYLHPQRRQQVPPKPVTLLYYTKSNSRSAVLHCHCRKNFTEHAKQCRLTLDLLYKGQIRRTALSHNNVRVHLLPGNERV